MSVLDAGHLVLPDLDEQPGDADDGITLYVSLGSTTKPRRFRRARSNTLLDGPRHAIRFTHRVPWLENTTGADYPPTRPKPTHVVLWINAHGGETLGAIRIDHWRNPWLPTATIELRPGDITVTDTILP
jgi:hypothetical protein